MELVTETIEGAELQQALPVFIDLASSKISKTGRPGVMATTHSGVEVSQNDDMFIGGMLFMMFVDVV